MLRCASVIQWSTASAAACLTIKAIGRRPRTGSSVMAVFGSAGLSVRERERVRTPFSRNVVSKYCAPTTVLLLFLWRMRIHTFVTLLFLILSVFAAARPLKQARIRPLERRARVHVGEPEDPDHPDDPDDPVHVTTDKSKPSSTPYLPRGLRRPNPINPPSPPTPTHVSRLF
ncbi:hypothetical protein EI94DRAFT_796012 [Lactarius quietus]|nr:hypothetical protein EI94DRAFT_1291285 [Lactarius quietus]KAF8261497.1 hypothetical protein EI94DRAFT_796012 [Lactarius quietus]